MIELERDERDRFLAHAHKTTHTSRTLLTFGLPLLFLVGWLRDLAVMPDDADQALLRRGVLVAALLLCAWLIQWRRLRIGREIAGIAYVCLYSIGICMTTLAEPSRFSLTHVAAMLMIIILLPYAFRPTVMVGTLLALVAPLVLLLVLFDASPALWFAYLAYVLVGCVVGLAQRRAYLDSALDIFQLRKRLLARLHIDPLTGVLNRNGWDAQVRKHMLGRDGPRAPLCIAYFDLDNFKSINDLIGHAAGDVVLQSAAEVIASESGRAEAVARLGGEEFVALLPGVTEDDAYRYAERIRQAVERRAGPVAMTLSAGVAQHSEGESLEALMGRADVALLEAKRLGRNRVRRASDAR